MKTLEELDELHSILFDTANEFAIAKQGTVAVSLHQAANYVGTAIRMLKEGVSILDKVQQANDWCDRQPFPMSEHQREAVIALIAKT